MTGSADSTASRLTRLRAGVLGANDGIVSVAGLVIGVAAAGSSAILESGLAGLAAGAVSMGLGEYVSVSAQRDTEQAMLARGEPGVDAGDLVNPWQAATSSAVSFTCGAVLPLLAAVLTPATWRLLVTYAAVLAALAITGTVAARLGDTDPLRPTVRVVVGGAVAMAITYGIGRVAGLTGL